MKDFTHSLEYLKQALISDATHHGLLSNIGTAYKGLNKYNEALDYFKSLKICPGMCSTLNNIGSLYFKQKEYPMALSYFEHHFRLIKKIWILF